MVILQPQNASVLVWAVPGSLAATDGIDVSFCSCGYLDVSVLRVPSPFGVLRVQWVSPFGNPRVNAYLQLVLAYRR